MDTGKIGAFIAQMRRAMGYTQEELGRRLNVTAPAISKWERGLSFPDVSLLNRLVNELKISVAELLNGERARPLENSSLRNDSERQVSGNVFAEGDVSLTLSSRNDSVVSPYLFGNNVEHTRSAVSGGLSAQMLRNRKFVGNPGSMLGVALEWFPIGERTFCQFAKGYTHHIKEKYHMRRSMEHNSQRVCSFSGTEESGVGQHGLSVVSGREYEFAAVVTSNADVTLTVRLTARGGGTVLAEAVFPIRRSEEWTRYTAALSPAGTDPDADLRITFTTAAAVTFGALSLLPTDHFHGMRRDVIALMKEMGIKVLRWPGGNFAGEYSWFDGLLPVDERSPFESYLHFLTQPHTFGYDNHEINTDDFIALCREIGADPYITTNLAWNTPEESAAWVEYCNGDESTEYGRMRAERGHPEPYHVMLWSLGNEFGYGHMEGDNTAYGYTLLAEENAKKMLEVCPNLSLCAAGPYPEERWAQYSARPLKDRVPMVSLHYYAQSFPTFLDPEKLRSEYEECLSGVEEARSKIRELREQIDPSQKICFDEWNLWFAWFRPSGVIEGIFTALMYHMIIGEAQRSGIDLACQYEAVNESAILVTPERAILTATGQAISVVGNHAGGFLRHASDCAVVTERDGTLTATLINPLFDRPKRFRIPLCGEDLAGELYRGDDIYPHSRFAICPLPFVREGESVSVELPPHSLACLRCATGGETTGGDPA